MVDEPAAPEGSSERPLHDPAIYRQVERSVWRIVRAPRWHLSAEVQEDVAQQAFSELLDLVNRGPPMPLQEIVASAERLACWRCLDESRKLRTRYSVPLDPDTRAATPDPLQELLAKDQVARLRLAIDRLPEVDRVLIQQRIGAGLKQKEIAEREGVPAATVRTRWNRCLKRLREELDRLGGGSRDQG